MRLRVVISLAVLLMIQSEGFAKERKLVRVAVFEPILNARSYMSTPTTNLVLETLRISKRLTNRAIEKCGYEIDLDLITHEKDYKPTTIGKARKIEQEKRHWFSVGPRMSDHFLVMTRAARSIPSISPMAGSTAVQKLDGRFLTAGVFGSDLVKALIAEAKKRVTEKRPSYITIVTEGCYGCADFAAEFDKAAMKSSFTKLREFSIPEGSNDFRSVKQYISVAREPTFVLLPMKGTNAATAIRTLHPNFPNLFFLGNENWGDSEFGSVRTITKYPRLKALAVKGFPPGDVQIKRKEIDALFTEEEKAILKRSPSTSTLPIIYDLGEFLCRNKPQNFDEFQKVFDLKGKSFFVKPSPLSVYEFVNGKFTYSYDIPRSG